MDLITQILAVAKAALELARVVVEALSAARRLRQKLKGRKH